MRTFIQRLVIFYQNSAAYPVFNRQDELARGRTWLILSSIVANLASVMMNGVFYTGFLLANGIDIVNISIVGFLPMAASVFSLVSPQILERIRKRKLLLLSVRFSYYFLIIAGITLLPYIGLPEAWKIPVLMVIVFVGHSCNAFSSPGFFVWHKKLLPDQIRPHYFSFSLAITGSINAVTVLLSSFLADALTADGQALYGMVIIRVVAMVFAAIDLVFLACIKEYPYERQKNTIRFIDSFRLPLQHKRFMLCMLINIFWNIAAYLPMGGTNVYLLDTVGISYTFINAMAAIYAVFLIVLTPLWRRIYSKLEMFKTLTLSYLVLAPIYILYGFVAKDNYMWLYPLVIVCLHVGNVGLNLTFSNLGYVHMPKQNETCYSSFHTICANLSAFVGQMIGTVVIGMTEGHPLQIGGMVFTNVQLLLITQGILMFALVMFIRHFIPFLSQHED